MRESHLLQTNSTMTAQCMEGVTEGAEESIFSTALQRLLTREDGRF